ncbi:MAG TPA: ketopantoate reductase C-terminal domain-containing protein [Anaerolineales bacterium]|nr:ketopantoate reductase C-terminal domain-containing protein [Anaerolineales bacterium]
MPDLKILSFGAGAIGTYIGGSLRLAGAQLAFVEQPSTAAELRNHGMRLDLSLDTRRKLHEASMLEAGSFVVAGGLEEALRYGPFDVALYALKSYDTAAAIEGMRPFADRLPPIWCLSNGVDNEPALAGLLGADKVIPGTVTSAIGRRGAGDIVLERLRGVGIAAGHPLSSRLLEAARQSLLNPRGYADPMAMKWSKLLTNLVANATSAILDMTAAEVLSNRKLYALEVAMLRECLAVMAAQGIPVVDLPGTPVRLLAFATRLPLWLSKPFLARAAGGGRGGKMPSFHIDLHAGRGKSEVQFLNGAVVRAGEQCGVPTPINRILTDTLLALTQGELPLEKFARKPAELLATG